MFSFILNINQDFVWIKKLQFPMDTATRKQKRRNTRCSITQSALIEKEHIELLVMQLLILLCCIQKPFSNGFFSFLFSKLSSCYWFFFLFIPSFHSSFLLSFFFGSSVHISFFQFISHWQHTFNCKSFKDVISSSFSYFNVLNWLCVCVCIGMIIFHGLPLFSMQSNSSLLLFGMKKERTLAR